MWDPAADADAVVDEALSPLHIAAARARTDVIAAFLGQCDGDLRAINRAAKDGRTPLDCANTVECITALLDGGATLGSPSPGTSTPLHVAAGHGSEAIVHRLLAAGAPVNATDEVRDSQGGI